MTNHPLFPLEEGDEPFECDWIGVRRYEGGEWRVAPRMFPADELESIEQFYELFGGGTYEIEARSGGASGRQFWTRKHKFTLGGPARPLYESPEPEAAAIPAAPAPAPADPGLLGGSNGLLLAILQMSQAQQAQTMALMMKSLEMSQQMMMSFATQGRGEQAGVIKAIADMSAADKANMFKLLETMGSVKSSGGDLGAFMKGVEFAAQSAEAGAPEPSADGDLNSTLEAVMGGLGAVADITRAQAQAGQSAYPVATPAAPQRPRPPSPPGPNAAG